MRTMQKDIQEMFKPVNSLMFHVKHKQANELCIFC